MTSPYASGGGGTHFEATVVSYYLAALLCRLPARGLLDSAVSSVRAQRGKLGVRLDDIIVAGTTEDGTVTALHLQVKNSIAFASGDANWIDVLQRAWDTFTQTDFDRTNMRFGVGIAIAPELTINTSPFCRGRATAKVRMTSSCASRDGTFPVKQKSPLYKLSAK
ncbi:MAG: hypothetical protein CBARDMAM_4443 [uncultured Caballeronia sp.]|nr:MAG: hypothetical protein CBARDMAM_4443 [uncultured Caballeronia sp.]